MLAMVSDANHLLLCALSAHKWVKSKVDKNVQVVQNSDCTMSFKAGDIINLSTEESKISRIYCSS